jgi:membrane-bound lytic murein transglycosylase B
MLTRRTLSLGIPLAIPMIAVRGAWGGDGFQSFLAGLRAEARKAGISPATIDRALSGLQPNEKVLERYRHQPEFTLSWAQYRALVVTEQRAVAGRAAWRQNTGLIQSVQRVFGVDASVVVGIWGLESSFGQKTGDFNVIEALATLSWEGRRAAFFRQELMAALRILDSGDIAPGRMTGSYAGAMGQPQFMPSSYLRYAVDFEGNGRRDIWTSKADTLASIANYLARSGWHDGAGWGEQIMVPSGFDASLAGREKPRAISEWVRLGIRRWDGQPIPPGGLQAAVLLPDGVGGEAFFAYPNFAAIRRYNPSDFYAIAVGLIGDSIAS